MVAGDIENFCKSFEIVGMEGVEGGNFEKCDTDDFLVFHM
jgi:hypothetical protein